MEPEFTRIEKEHPEIEDEFRTYLAAMRFIAEHVFPALLGVVMMWLEDLVGWLVN